MNQILSKIILNSLNVILLSSARVINPFNFILSFIDKLLFVIDRIFEKTHSLWPFLLQKKQELRNPLYRGFTAYKELQPNTLPFCFQ